MNDVLEQENAVSDITRACIDSLDSGIRAAQENITNTVSCIHEFLAAETEHGKEILQKVDSCGAAFDKLAASAGRLCEMTAELNDKLGVSCRALGVVENGEQLFNDAALNFKSAFEFNSLETQKTLQRITDRLLSVSHQCEFFKTSPKPWTEMVKLYSVRIESLFGKVEIKKQKALDVQAKTRRAYFLIDCSGSMRGEKIKCINKNIPHIINDLKNHGITHAGVLGFSKSCFWMNCSLSTEIAAFQWQNLKADSITNLGAAFFELFKALSIPQKSGAAPLIVVISDGEPTDDWENPLAALKELHCFRTAEKHAFVLEYSDKIEALAAFINDTKNDAKNIIHIQKPEMLLPALQKMFEKCLKDI